MFSDRTYEQLVTPNGNGTSPIHRWFHLKEAFSSRLLPQILADISLAQHRDLRVLDPFIGSGTAAISLADLVRTGDLDSPSVFGYECNPFLQLVASTKLEALQNPSSTFLSFAKRVAAAAALDRIEPAPIPDLSAFHQPSFFASADLTKLLQLRQAIQSLRPTADHPLDANLALTCLGGAIEPSSSLRRDGRALRFVPGKPRTRPIAEFLRRAECVAEDMPSRSVDVRGRVLQGDGRTLIPIAVEPQSVDLVLFSPPYPNNIDYTEVYKLEAWLLGYITTQDAFIEQRRKTLYSHPSVRRTGGLHSPSHIGNQSAAEALTALLAAIPADRYAVGRSSMLQGYFDDLLTTLTSAYQALRPAGYLIYVVGNSLHGAGQSAFVVAADILIAELATVIGFDVHSIRIARRLRRRGESPYLRESVVFLQRPAPATLGPGA
ncbi:MAG: hypothetical protein ACYCZN_15670 [Candidatus Dormibacteria bacterium]